MSHFGMGGFYYDPWEIPLAKIRMFDLWTVAYKRQKIAWQVSEISADQNHPDDGFF